MWRSPALTIRHKICLLVRVGHGAKRRALCLNLTSHLAVSWWRHQMETFSALLVICMGIHRSPVNSPHKGQWHGALMFSLICTRINGWVNTGEAGDLRRYRAHYDVTVMCTCIACVTIQYMRYLLYCLVMLVSSVWCIGMIIVPFKVTTLVVWWTMIRILTSHNKTRTVVIMF